MSMKKIAFLMMSDHLGRGGMENVLKYFVNALVEKNFECILYHKSQFMFDEFVNSLCAQTYCMPQIPALLAKKHFLRPRIMYRYILNNKMKHLFLKIASDRPDIIFILDADYKHIDLLRFLKGKLRNIPMISYFHGSLHNIINKPVAKAYLSLFEAHIAISNGMKENICSIIPNASVYMVNNPTKIGDLIKRPQKITKFIYIGRCDDPGKRVYNLLETMYGLKGNWQIDLYGDGNDNVEEMEKIKNYIVEKLNSKAKFHGWQSNPWSMIEEASVLLLNSESEGSSLVLCEAMVRGIPCVSSDCPDGPRCIVVEGINGWLYDVDDNAKLKNILQDIVNGVTILPPQDEIVRTVQKYAPEIVLEDFLSVINNKI